MVQRYDYFGTNGNIGRKNWYILMLYVKVVFFS